MEIKNLNFKPMEFTTFIEEYELQYNGVNFHILKNKEEYSLEVSKCNKVFFRSGFASYTEIQTLFTHFLESATRTERAKEAPTSLLQKRNSIHNNL